MNYKNYSCGTSSQLVPQAIWALKYASTAKQYRKETAFSFFAPRFILTY